MRTTPASDYLQPTGQEIREIARRVGLQTYSPQLVKDIANVASGGRVKASYEYSDELVAKIPEPTKDEYEGVYYYINEDGYRNYTDDIDIARRATERNVIRANEKVCEFIRTLDIDKAPGNTPLEKACGILLSISNSTASSMVAGSGETLPVFTNRPDNAAKSLNNVHDIIESLGDIETELLMDTPTSDKADDDEAEGGSGHGDGGLAKIKLVQDMINGQEHWLKVARNLNVLTRFRLGKSAKTTPDPEGDDVSKRVIRDFDEIGKIPEIEYLMPELYRMYRIATREIQVRERASRLGKKQLLYMLIDCSSSMRYDKQSIHKAGGVLFNRLKAVVEGQAELYFRFFDTKLFPEYQVRDVKEAKDAIETFKNHAFKGGGTDIPYAITESISRINELMNSGELENTPELVVVTDGEDNCRHIKKADFIQKGYKITLHAFVVDGTNKYLANLARQTDGVGVERI